MSIYYTSHGILFPHMRVGQQNTSAAPPALLSHFRSHCCPPEFQHSVQKMNYITNYQQIGNVFFFYHYQVTWMIFYYDNNIITYHFNSYRFLQSEGCRAAMNSVKAASEHKWLSVALVKHFYFVYLFHRQRPPSHSSATAVCLGNVRVGFIHHLHSIHWHQGACTYFRSPLCFYSGGRVYEIVTLVLWEQSRTEEMWFSGTACL